ncbi:sugar phosphorylase [Virgibacillus sp. Bac330]|uniref:sugar phosphorylase n=1 Tax=Virgibacillus sp. Bac330 TaxID=2419841 RepID=UPI000EF4AA37|nr:sugar phosphorylase [Virgibacillus sp. Bac330]
MEMEFLNRLEIKLKEIYGDKYRSSYIDSFKELIELWSSFQWKEVKPISEKSIYLITYGDSIYRENKPTLASLHEFLNEKLAGIVTDVHVLPMFPYTSDDGFSVTNYREIQPKLGNWENIELLSKDYRLMFDFVANHISKESRWFQGYLNGEETYQDYFIPKDDSFDTSKVVRPRTSPLYHQYQGKNGVKTAWTTFSEDQVDLNFSYFPLLLEMTDILLLYASKGGTSIRLDAIGFIWKKSGTSSIHMPQAHAIIQLWRMILDYLQPNTQIITETNVPHQENISYFGDGTNEANMVYQFSLPPLVLFALTTHNSKKLSNWAEKIGKVSDTSTFFNFLASHDGIGMRPVEGILSEDEKELLVEKVKKNGGRISYKNNPDGTKSVYELNINYSDALMNEEDISEQMQVNKILAAHAILLSFIGVPAIYYHSILGSRNDLRGVQQSNINRRINREKLELQAIIKELGFDSRRKGIFEGLLDMITIRKQEKSFSPYAEQEVLHLGGNVFSLRRFCEKSEEEILFVVNVDSQPITIPIPATGVDLWSRQEVEEQIRLNPYQFMWIKQNK